MPARNAIVRVGLSVLLLATAGLKLHGLSISVPQVGWFAQPWVQLLTAEWELVLAAWLVSGAQPRIAWVASLVTFLVFSAVSGYLGWAGVASCACFGTIHANPWWAFGIDVICLVILAMCRPPVAPRIPQPGRKETIRLTVIATGVGLLFVCSLAGAVVIYGSVEVAQARIAGVQVAAFPNYISLGEGGHRKEESQTVEVRNFSDRQVKLIGWTSDCSCVVTDDLPKVIGPGERVSLRLRITPTPTSQGRFTRTVEIWTDCPAQRTLRIVVSGVVE